MEYVLVNGVVTKKTEAETSTILWDNSLLVSQQIWFGYGGIPLLNENLTSLSNQLAALGYELPPLLKNNRELYRLCKRMLNKNKHFRSGHLVIRLFLSEQATNYLISSENNEIFDFPIAEEGLLANISEFRKHSNSAFRQFAFNDYYLWKAAQANLNDTNFGTSVFFNEKGFVCEAIKANIFLLKNNTLLTPSLESGCYTDVIRDIIISLANQLKIKTIESAEISKEMLLDADEVFLASETEGIQWLLGIENKRFIRYFSPELHQLINQHLKTKA